MSTYTFLKQKIEKLIHRIHTILQHQGFIKYLKNTSWLMLDKVLRLFLGLFIGVWVARYLGPENYGILNFAMSFVGLFSVFSNLGLDGIVIREILKYGSKRDEFLGTSFVLKFFGSFFVLLFTYISMHFTSTTALEKIIIMIIAFGQIFVSFDIFDLFFQSQVKGKYSSLSGTFSLIISSGIRVVLILSKLSLIWFALVVIVEQMIKSLFFIYFYKTQKLTLRTLKFNKSVAYSLLKNSWPLMLSSMAIMIYMRIDQVMLKEILGNEAVGLYAAAVRISEAWYFIPMVITSSLFPAIINAKNISRELYCKRLQRLYTLMVWLSVSIALPMTFLSGWIINSLYGIKYNESAAVLIIHIWSGIFVSLGVAFGKYLVSENFTKKYFARTLLGVLANVILNYFLIKKYGISGAAIATFVGQFVSNYLYDFFDKDLYGQLIMKTKSLLPIYITK